jgi:hypothetical protein
MSHKKWFRIVVFVAIFFLLGTAVINYVVDPFDIFHTQIFDHQYQPNERYRQIEFLYKNHTQYNSYILGSSRVGTIDPQFIEKYIVGSRFYNCVESLATNHDYLMNLKYFLDNKYELKNIYLQIDLDINMIEHKMSDDDYLRKYHPFNLGKSKFTYYMQYLFMKPAIKNIYKKIEWKLKNKYSPIQIDENSGKYSWIEAEKLIESDQNAYIKSQSNLNINEVNRTRGGQCIEENINDLKELVRLCRENNISLIIFTTPNNYNVIDTFDTKIYMRFLNELANVTPYWDFSGYNTITLDNKYYYESSHYRPIVAQLVAARIFNDNSIDVPDDFGVLVNQSNINKHLNILEKQIQNRDASYNKTHSE